MNKITGRHNYDNGYIGLVDIGLEGLPDSIDFDGYHLTKKDEFHISLLCAKRIAPLVDQKNAKQIEAGLVEDFLEFNRVTSLTKFALTREFRFVELDERKAIVVMAEVPGIDEFFRTLSEKYDTKFPVQPTHITLYTLQPNTGIGILSYDQLNEISQPAKLNLEITTLD